MSDTVVQLTAAPRIYAEWTAVEWSNETMDTISSDKTVPYLQ